MRIKSETLKWNGVQYLQIKTINPSLQILSDIKMNIKFNSSVPKLIQSFVNEQAKSNWKQLKPLLESDFEENISEIIYEMFTPLFTKVPIHDFFVANSKLIQF